MIKLLMVENESDVLEINREFLEGKGYDVICASTLSKARFCVEEYSPDLILLDMIMPDGSGFDFCAEIRQKTSAPIILLSYPEDKDNIIEGLLKGGDDYISKPWDLNILSAKVTAQLRRAGNMNSGKITLQPLTVDLLAGEAILDGERIALTQKELQLLGYFALFARRRLHVDDIYHRVWGETSTGAAGVIKTHVSNIRKKLRMDDGGWFELVSTGKNEYIFSKIRN